MRYSEAREFADSILRLSIPVPGTVHISYHELPGVQKPENFRWFVDYRDSTS